MTERPNLELIAEQGCGAWEGARVAAFALSLEARLKEQEEERDKLVQHLADLGPPICGVICESSWHLPVACAHAPGHPSCVPHSWASIPALDPREQR